MPANSDSPTHCLLYRAPDAERWRMFAYFDDLTEDGCEMLLKLCEYEFAPHFEELGDEFTAAWEPSEYEFKCIVQDGHVAKRSKLGSDMRELDRLTSRQKAFGGKEDVDTLILWNIAHKARTNKNQVHTVTRDVGKDGGSESGPEGPSYTATKAGVSDTGQKEPASDVAASKQVNWSDDAEFLHNKEAVTLSKGKISPSVLSKLLTPTGPIRYMRTGQRCKVHVGDFMRHLSTMAGGLSENEASDIADEFLSGIDERKAAEREKKKGGK